MTTLRLVFADQLSDTLSALDGICSKDVVMLCEVMEEATYVPHHPKKIAFLFAAMRHFAQSLRTRGMFVHYVSLDDPSNTGSFTTELLRAVACFDIDHIITTQASEYRVLLMQQSWTSQLGIPVDVLPDTRFLATTHMFSEWAKNKKQLRMEFFYREMRKKHGILIDAAGQPTGGAWNYDKENRKPPKIGMRIPKRLKHAHSETTTSVLALVKQYFSHHFGTLEPFEYAVTREQALLELTQFIEVILPNFGDYQDAMVAGEPYLYHSLLSSYLNAGLLLPLEICKMAESAYHLGHAPLNAVEGFIRQILGWREYIRGIYWQFMPDYALGNGLNATRPLPAFYWGAPTKMFCVAESVRHTREHSYSHHIQRLMVTGNFALLAGLDVHEVQQWYLAVYSDAYEWVELPNTLGMALFGDGGIVASKPYAASGKYIQRMSNYCNQCAYRPNEMLGDQACPFNALYWDFLVRHESMFRGNQRMPFVFATWDKFALEKQQAIQLQAQHTLEKMQLQTL